MIYKKSLRVGQHFCNGFKHTSSSYTSLPWVSGDSAVSPLKQERMRLISAVSRLFNSCWKRQLQHVHRNGLSHPLCMCVCVHSDLVVSIQFLVFSLTLPEGLALGLKCLSQVSVLQTFLRVLLRQHLQLPLDGLQLLPASQKQKKWISHRCSVNTTAFFFKKSQIVAEKDVRGVLQQQHRHSTGLT